MGGGRRTKKKALIEASPPPADAPEAQATTPPAPSAETADTTRIPFFARLHPTIVHFPIACLVLAVLAEALMLWRGLAWANTVLLLVATGAGGALLATLSGTFLADDQAPDLLDRHRQLGWITLAAAVIALGATLLSRRRPELRWPLRLALLLAATLVSATGHFGGSMVYGRHWLW